MKINILSMQIASLSSKRQIEKLSILLRNYKDTTKFNKHVGTGKTTKRRITHKEKEYGQIKSILLRVHEAKDLQGFFGEFSQLDLTEDELNAGKEKLKEIWEFTSTNTRKQ